MKNTENLQKKEQKRKIAFVAYEDIWLDESLTWTEKILLTLIDRLDNDFKCVATNQALAKMLGNGMSERSITRLISSLEKKQYISISNRENKRVIEILDRQSVDHKLDNLSTLDRQSVDHKLDNLSTLDRQSVDPLYNKYTEDIQNNTTEDIQSNNHVEQKTIFAQEKQKNKKPNSEQKKIIAEQFQDFWHLYNHKKSRAKALAKFRLALKKTSFEKIMQAVGEYNAYLEEKNPSNPREFKKHPTTWINQECWNDEYTSDTKASEKKESPERAKFFAQLNGTFEKMVSFFSIANQSEAKNKIWEFRAKIISGGYTPERVVMFLKNQFSSYKKIDSIQGAQYRLGFLKFLSESSLTNWTQKYNSLQKQNNLNSQITERPPVKLSDIC